MGTKENATVGYVTFEVENGLKDNPKWRFVGTLKLSWSYPTLVYLVWIIKPLAKEQSNWLSSAMQIRYTGSGHDGDDTTDVSR